MLKKINNGLAIIFLNNNEDKPKFWLISLSNSFESGLGTKINKLNNKMFLCSSLPSSIKQLIKNNNKDILINKLYAIDLEENNYDVIAIKCLITKHLYDLGYESIIPTHKEWFYKQKEYLYKDLQLNSIQLYKTNKLTNNYIEEFNWLLSNDLWVNKNTLSIVDSDGPINYLEKAHQQLKLIVDKEVKNHLNSNNIDCIIQMLEIESIIQDTTIKDLVYNLISDKAKKILNLVDKK